MVKKSALWFGVILLLVGILGYIPAFAPNGFLLGIFRVDGFHNLVHVVTGAIGIWAGLSSFGFARGYFQVFGVIYALVTILGLFYGNAPLLGVMAHNWADFWLHVVITLFALYMGFAAAPARRHVTTY